MPEYRTFELTLAHYSRAKEIRRSLKKAGCYIHPRARWMIKQCLQHVHAGKKRVRVAILSSENLGLGRSATYEEICRQARERGFKECSAEIGIALRKKYLDQPGSETVYIAMEPVLHPIGNAFIFVLVTPFGNPLLYSEFAHSTSEFSMLVDKDFFAFIDKD